MRGCLLICIGLTKKVFLADPMGDFVDTVYGSYADYGSGALVLATYAFALQIYFDFSAYTDIAIGAAAILGFRLTQNFRAPYLAASIREFWRRWHISLSTWLRDYLYVSLGGSRHGTVRTYCALSATMLLGGLWHGAAWTFVIWGALHGLYLVVERLSTTRPRDSSAMGPLERLIRTAITLHLVCFAWIFFRAESFEQAFGIVGRIVTLAPGESVSAVPALCLIALMAWQYLRERRPYLDVSALVQWPVPARWTIYAMLPLLIVAIAGARSPEFIYFQF
jgi:D-alanyl-lipoteichoic acid acyltransferase DltB (MBOAT superfamily)